MSPSSQPLVIALMGPTASGKTALAIEIALALDLAVLSVDSRQLYKEMTIGTAKPTAEQRAAVRHELLDLRAPDQPINLQEFRQEADQAIEAEHKRRGIAFLVGGSGLYIKAITQGMTPPAVPPQPQLRRDLEALGQSQCYALLRQADGLGQCQELRPLGHHRGGGHAAQVVGAAAQGDHARRAVVGELEVVAR